MSKPPSLLRPPDSPWRHRLHEIIFEADTPLGRAFDIALLVTILLSVAAVVLESVAEIRLRWGALLRAMEWGFTILFTVEYLLRLLCVRRPLRYAGSFFGIVDLLALLPTYLSMIFVGAQSLLVIRGLRLLRVFRVFKLALFVGEAELLAEALRESARKIFVFLSVVIALVLVTGSVMYLVEGEENGFTNIPQSIYWAIVTLTTVGYGDMVPKTALGKMLASLVMILGYGIIAVPTGIVTAALSRGPRMATSLQACPHCMAEGHVRKALFCHACGENLQG